VLAYARLIAAVGVDDGGEVLDDEESGYQPVVEIAADKAFLEPLSQRRRHLVASALKQLLLRAESD
jgi:hypothetical protein